MDRAAQLTRHFPSRKGIEGYKGPVKRFIHAYLPAIILFTVIRMLMLWGGIKIVNISIIDEPLGELLRFLNNWYLLNFG